MFLDGLSSLWIEVMGFPLFLGLLPALNTTPIISTPAVRVAHVTVWIISRPYSQIIARGLLDIFRDFSNNEEDLLTVMEIVVRLSEDAGLYKDCILLFFVYFQEIVYNQ